MTAVSGFEPHWTAPPNVRTFVTTRTGGVSAPPFESFNLALHVGDDAEAVAENRRRLREGLCLPAEPAWTAQVHGTRCTRAEPEGAADAEADAAVVEGPGAVGVVLTADCLPVVLARADGAAAAVAHAGWRGLAAGVVDEAVRALGSPERIHAYLGPAIGPDAFEVGAEVREAFLAGADEDRRAFHARNDRWLANLYILASQRLKRLGVPPHCISGGGFCTFSDGDRFFSHRRDGQTGRMATLVWLEEGGA
ncbi:peptidoglycan editing factor PgeF [Thiohalorhabdus methylotrophus]|uniref:Purine nucleoside phosphorylase n=1 Tax=Thiohalorhabdus methylotrophus TaxID=3242694 RepID=A0ABV4TUE4_9GAMM